MSRAAGNDTGFREVRGDCLDHFKPRQEPSSQGAADAQTSFSFYPALANFSRNRTSASLKEKVNLKEAKNDLMIYCI